jgi:hypothetical protein
MKVSAVDFIQDDSAASRNDATTMLGQLVDHLLLNNAERRLALTLKVLPDRAAQTLLYHQV